MVDVIQYYQEILDNVPEEYQHLVKIEFDTAWDRFEGDYIEMDVYYSRPETEEEQAQRAARDKRIDDEEKSRKLAQFEKLKKELGL
jgi:hypothetical protein